MSVPCLEPTTNGSSTQRYGDSDALAHWAM